MPSLLKRLIPASLVPYILALRATRYRLTSPFSGVFSNWEDVPKIGKEFEDDEWAEVAAQHSRQVMAQDGFVSPYIKDEDALLPFLVAMCDKPPSILDFGGATGFGYLYAKQGAVKPFSRYVIVEHPAVCEKGRALFDDPRVEFTSEIPRGQFDVVLIGSSLQCIPDHKALLETLTWPRPRWFLFTKLPAGENPTYVTTQINLPGKRHPLRLFNVHEIVATMGKQGYRLAFKGAAAEISQPNFEPRYRVGRYCNLLFESH